jgi:SNF2 family DNA or RNA helicase
VFSQFTHALDLLTDELEEEGIFPFRLDGKKTSRKRTALVKTFQESEKPQVFLISMKAGGTGLNLTRASDVILLDQWWNPAVDAQAIDRAHRIGQSREVRVWRLIMAGTIEEKILSLQGDKQMLFDQLVEEPARRKSANGTLSREDFEFLLG